MAAEEAKFHPYTSTTSPKQELGYTDKKLNQAVTGLYVGNVFQKNDKLRMSN